MILVKSNVQLVEQHLQTFIRSDWRSYLKSNRLEADTSNNQCHYWFHIKTPVSCEVSIVKHCSLIKNHKTTYEYSVSVSWGWVSLLFVTRPVCNISRPLSAGLGGLGTTSHIQIIKISPTYKLTSLITKFFASIGYQTQDVGSLRTQYNASYPLGYDGPSFFWCDRVCSESQAKE